PVPVLSKMDSFLSLPPKVLATVRPDFAAISMKRMAGTSAAASITARKKSRIATGFPYRARLVRPAGKSRNQYRSPPRGDGSRRLLYPLGPRAPWRVENGLAPDRV